MLLVRSLMKTVRPDTEFIGGRAFPSGATIHHKASAARSGSMICKKTHATMSASR
jgi:hypothetical protein